MRITAKHSKSILSAFSRDESGNFAVIFALCILMLMVSIGAAMDYSRMNDDRSKFQGALDAATLNAAISLRKHKWNKAKKNGKAHFKAHVPLNMESSLKSVKFTYEDETVYGKVKGKSENYFMGLVGIHKIDYEVDAAVYFPDYPIEVALVLDTTYSMVAGNKIGTLKTAAKDFVDSVLSSPTADRKISIVPFAQYVNVGRDKMGSTWLDATDEVIHVPQQCSTVTPIVSQSGCSTQSTNHPAVNVPESCSPATYNDGVLVSPASCTAAYTQPAYTSSSQSCTNITYGPPETTCQPPYDYTVYWNGCVASRNYPRNLEDVDFSFRVPGPNSLVCPSEILPLTDKKSKLKNKINALTPVGSTYIPQGVAWGARTLSKMKPYGQAKSKTKMANLKGRRFLVLMTDGINVSSPLVPSSPLHTGNDAAKADTWLAESCENAKDNDIEIFTVSFGASVNATTQTLLRECATSDDNYFHAETNADFKNSFSSIADLILALHLSV